MKKVFLIISLLLLGWTSDLLAQAQLRATQIDSINGLTFTKCEYYLVDDGGIGGNYSNNKEYVTTLCASSLLTERMSLRFDTFIVHPSDTLWIHEGMSVSNPLVAFNGDSTFTGNVIMGQTIKSPLTGIGCLTLRFKSDASNREQGFLAYVACEPRCQYPVPSLDTFFVNYSPDGTMSRKRITFDVDADSVFKDSIVGVTVDSVNVYYIEDPENIGDSIMVRDTVFSYETARVFVRLDSVAYAALDICEGDSIGLVAKPGFPDNDMLYHQSDSTCIFYWNFGEKDDNGRIIVDTIVGNPHVGNRWKKTWGYNLVLSIRDTTNIGNLGGCLSPVPASYRVRISENPVRSIARLADMCSGTTQDILSGYGGNASIMVDSIPHPVAQKERFVETTFIPDGPNCDGERLCFTAPVTFDKFMDGAVLMNASCLNSVCINMEHSFIGDFTMRIICPNEQSAMLKPKGGSGTFLGSPADGGGVDFTSPCTAPPNIEGTGWTYCFSNNFHWSDTTIVANNTVIAFPCGSTTGTTLTSNTNFISQPDTACYMFLIGYNMPQITLGIDVIDIIHYDTVIVQADSIAVVFTADSVTISDNNTFSYSHSLKDSVTKPISYYMNFGEGMSGPTAPTVPVTGTYGGFTTSGSTIDSTWVEEDTLHYLKPWADFTGLIGCPLNGEWVIEVCDTWGIDNGFIFWWDMELGDCPGSGVWDYTTYLDSVLWDGPFISRIDEANLKLVPPIDTGGYFRYTLHLVDNFGCVWDTAAFINIVERPVIDLGEDIKICEGEPITLDATHRSATGYLWSDGTTEPTLTIIPDDSTPQNTSYSVNLLNKSGSLTCSYMDSINITIKPQALASLSSDPDPLEGCEPFTFQLINNSSNMDSFEWQVGELFSTEMNPVFTLPYGDYVVKLRVTSSEGCMDSVYLDSTSAGDRRIHVYSHPVPDFAWEPNNPYASAPSAQMINLSQPDRPTNTYKWVYQSNKNNPNDVQVKWGREPILTWQPQSGQSVSGDYDITLTAYINSVGYGGHQYQCYDSIKRTITIVNDNLIFPNVVTPNGDGINDTFIIHNLINGQAFPDNELTIYNRYGRLIYFKEDLRINEQGWDPNETNTPDGTYFYHFIGRGPVRDVEYTGTIDVLRGK
ncbi:MAG: gliding motility-associated C-terminal domain-containing protein [Bacteroidales bacterium]|jgi:gliding motility-associated-like protein|nr:gliding motility-associated C-terminal domain-containing protein [Bacteroidales bacterium]